MTKPSPTDAPGPAWLGVRLPPLTETAVALALGVLIFFRPWHDGITYPERNVWFTWGIAGTAVFWSLVCLVRSVKGRDVPANLAAVGLAALFLLIALASVLWTVQYNATYRALVNWTGYVLLFAVASSAIRSRWSLGIVVSFFVVSSIAETVWAILHIEYSIKLTRELIRNDPSMLQRFFNVTELTPDLKSRLESNRASGSLLFANALASWVLVGLLFSVGAAANGWVRLRDALKSGAGAAPRPSRNALRRRAGAAFAVGFAVFVIAFVAITLYYSLYFAFAYRNDDWLNHPIRWSAYCLGLPVVFGFVSGGIAKRWGTRIYLLGAQTFGFAAFGLLQAAGLAHTYSRGGMLATVAALLVGLWLMRSVRFPRLSGRVKAATPPIAAAVLVGVALAVYAQPDAPPPEPSPMMRENLQIEGHNVSMEAMMDPWTMFLRVSYWRSGLNMIAANFFTGVGLGNFGTVYPMYQYLGAGDVKQAHNDYLQMWCETGVFGFLAFAGFWGYFVVWGARKITAQPDLSARWLLTGLFMATLGFLFHAAVDFDFYNPSLATLAFLMAGLLMSAAGAEKPPARTMTRVIAVGAAVVAILVSLAAYRTHQLDSAFGTEFARRSRFDSAELVYQLSERGMRNPNEPIREFDHKIEPFIPQREDREEFGTIYAPVNLRERTFRPLGPNEPVPPNSAFQFTDFAAARRVAQERAQLWPLLLGEADRVFPHDPSASAHIFLWYEFLHNKAQSREEKTKWIDEALKWAEECARRSPQQVPYNEVVGRALWQRAALESTVKQLEYFDRAIAVYKRCAELYPVKPFVWRDYGQRCLEYGTRRVEAGDAKGGQPLVDEGNRALKHADELQAQWDRIEAQRSQ